MSKAFSFLSAGRSGRRIAIWLGGPTAIAVLAGSLYVALPAGAQGGDHAAPISTRITSPEQATNALAAAEERFGVSVEVPGYFATSADGLVWIDASSGPPGVSGALPKVELTYLSDEAFAWGGQWGDQERRSTTTVYLLDTRLKQPNGELLQSGVAGWDLYKEIAFRGEDGTALVSDYTAVKDSRTIIMMFQGEQPSDDGVFAMLESFSPAD